MMTRPQAVAAAVRFGMDRHAVDLVQLHRIK